MSDNLSNMYKTYREKLVPVAKAIVGDEATAEDIVQDVFLKIMLKGKEILNPEDYLYKAVVNQALNESRNREKRPTFTDLGWTG